MSHKYVLPDGFGCSFTVDDKGKFHGVYKQWDSSGRLMEINYKHGIRHGKHVIYKPKKYICFYANDLLHGEAKGWNGKLPINVLYEHDMVACLYTPLKNYFQINN